MHTLYVNFFGCKWPMKKSYEKTLKNYVTSSKNLKEK